MKRTLVILMVLILSVISITPAGAIDAYNLDCTTLVLTVGNKTAHVDGVPHYSPVAPFIKSGRIFVPLRFVAEELNATVLWDDWNHRIDVRTNDMVDLEFSIGDKRLYVTDHYNLEGDNNWSQVNMDVAPFIKNGYTFVALRYVFEPMGALVNYNSKSKTVTVKRVDIKDWKTYTEPFTQVSVRYPDTWEVETEGLYLDIYKNGTEFIYSYEDKAQRDVISYNRNLYVNKGWKVATDTGTYIKLTKQNRYSQSIKIISTRKFGAGSLVYTVNTDSNASEWDLLICDKMTPGPGI